MSMHGVRKGLVHMTFTHKSSPYINYVTAALLLATHSRLPMGYNLLAALIVAVLAWVTTMGASHDSAVTQKIALIGAVFAVGVAGGVFLTVDFTRFVMQWLA